MNQALIMVSFLDIRLCAIPGHAQNLVIVLGLAPFQSRFGFPELCSEIPRFSDTVFELGQLQCGFEVGDGALEVFEM